MDSSSADEQSRTWAELPADITSTILSKVGAIDVLTSAQRVCSSWLGICRDPAMWRNIDMHNLGDLWDMEHDLEKMCRHAVDRSEGHLLSINIEYFGTDELLEYIARRSSRLRNLRLVSCYSISDQGFGGAVANFPLLEELDLSYCSLSKEALEAVGKSCPLLKSLKLNSQGYRYPKIECDEEAIAIAENMHGLRHLQIFGNKLTNNGLQAILDGCPLLQSLDLRQCFNVSLGGNLEKICTQRIKDLRRPNDSTDDYEFDPEVQDVCWSSAEDDYPSGISDIELASDEDDYYEFSDNDYDFDYDYMFND
ncbi:F-box protein [Melia azedarach]|uniref:F-box protein n=1 Tax=Melia azedarach TaxID=155640 RepID=A0ACC1WVP4_MELAZ|nr:F-box protein [Melia azedarach]